MKRHHLAAIPSLIITSIHTGAHVRGVCTHVHILKKQRRCVIKQSVVITVIILSGHKLQDDLLLQVFITHKDTNNLCKNNRYSSIHQINKRGKKRRGAERETSSHTSQTHCMTLSSEKNNHNCVPPETKKPADVNLSRISTCFHQRPRMDKGDVII